MTDQTTAGQTQRVTDEDGVASYIAWLDRMASGVSNMRSPRTDNSYGFAAQRLEDVHARAQSQAATIAELRAEVERLTKINTGLCRDFNAMNSVQGRLETRTREAESALATATARIEKLEAALRWRPIETAPKDGTKILLAKIVGHPDHDTALWWACRGYWSSKWNNWNDGVEPCGLAGPTHWLPANGHGIVLAALQEDKPHDR